jgi:hypothetical protein
MEININKVLIILVVIEQIAGSLYGLIKKKKKVYILGSTYPACVSGQQSAGLRKEYSPIPGMTTHLGAAAHHDGNPFSCSLLPAIIKHFACIYAHKT